MELGHWVTGSMGHLDHLSRPGHRVIILTRCETRVFPVFEKSPRYKDIYFCENPSNRHWNIDIRSSKFLLSRSVQTPNSDKNWQTSCPLQTFVCSISGHLEFIIEQGHRVNWVSGSLDSRVTGSLGHKMWPSSTSGAYHMRAPKDIFLNWLIETEIFERKNNR